MKQNRRSNSFLEYDSPQGTIWRIDAFKEFSSFFGNVHALQMTELHRLSEKFQAGWTCARMLYGINPLTPDQTDTSPDFFRSHTREEVLAALKLKLGATFDESDMDAEMATIQDGWKNYVEKHPFRPPNIPERQVIIPPKSPEELAMDKPLTKSEEAWIMKFGFSLEIFSVPGRDPSYKIPEMRWFYERLLELKKAFEEPMAKGHARQALLNEMQMRRVDDELSRTHVLSGKFWSTHDTKMKIEEVYSKQWADVEKYCPFIKAAEGRINFVGLITDVIEAIRQWECNKDNTLVSGLWTAFELQIELRQSKQADVRLRPGWMAAIQEAKDNLWNPKYTRSVTDYHCKMMDEGFRKGVELLNERTGKTLPDLERDDRLGEYEELYLPKEADLGGPEIPLETVEVIDPPIPTGKKTPRE